MALTHHPAGRSFLIDDETMRREEWRAQVLRDAGARAQKMADEQTEKRTAELRAEVAVQKAVIDELARRLALLQLPPEAGPSWGEFNAAARSAITGKDSSS